MTRYADLTNEQRNEVETSVRDAGYLGLESTEAQVNMCTEVGCPLCNSPLEIYTKGGSYQISCPTHGRIVVVRAFSTPVFA